MKYLETFVENLIIGISERDIPRQLDVVLEGGAMNGAYQIGAMCYLKSLEKVNKTKVMRISGVSCGALIGALYLTVGFENVEEYYNNLTNSLLSSGNFACLKKCIDDFISKLSDDTVKGLTNRLFISYIDLNTQERIVKSEYNSKEELGEILLKTAYLPGFIDGKLTTTDKCIDGGFPYIFPNDIDKRQEPNYRTLYLKLSSFNILKDAISTKGELNIARRAVEGIQKTHDLFKQRCSNEIASIVEDWTKIEILKHTVLNLSWWIVIYLTHFIVLAYGYVPESIKEHIITLRIKNILFEVWNDYICRMLT
jgi:hypothetical protein